MIGSPGPGSVGYSEARRGYATTATYSCDPGYDILVTGDLSGPERYTRTCLTSTGVAAWSGGERACEAVTCRALPIPEGGSVAYDVPSRVFPVVATITCDEANGFTLVSGDSVRTCTDKNTWSGQVSVCSDAACPPYSKASPAGLCGCTFGGGIVFPNGQLCCGPRERCPAGFHYENGDACDINTGEYTSLVCTPVPCPPGTVTTSDPDPLKACACDAFSSGSVQWVPYFWQSTCATGRCFGVCHVLLGSLSCFVAVCVLL